MTRLVHSTRPRLHLDRALATMPQQRAWRHAKYVLVQAGRSVKP